MSLKLMYITNKPQLAKIAEESGVDWIFIDLEINGKEKRQEHLDTVISRHSIEDIYKVKKYLNKSKLLVRVNPIYENSMQEINKVIENGADIVMLPFFKSVDEVKKFIQIIDKKAEVCLLVETPEAIECLDNILQLEGIDYIHIGLNDLHLGYHMKFMFEPLANGMVDKIANKIKKKGIPFGFGGIAQLGQGTLPAENILIEHYRLESSMVILSRSFCDIKKVKDLNVAKVLFKNGVSSIRSYEKLVEKLDEKKLINNHSKIIEIVNKICCS